MSKHLYLVALGSNQRHHRYGAPRQVLARAIARIDDKLGKVVARSRLIETAPVGPSQRRYINGALVLSCELKPAKLLRKLQRIERKFGRVRRGQRWRSRPLDLDIVLWSGGIFVRPELAIPHPLFRERDFVLGPAAGIAGDWRDPVTGLTLRQLHGRLTRRRPLSR
ncbi:2-amino-4-hydroxy-6-hydroxymethyldihydropteridine diphosphokinase [Aurantiacibacter xanthus]|uniref:2-amino-4-hydroxy-6-hydroxymethyldihydropteridine pyrophosphokinase n=1 Tax=Aurantiacibacter xanthus TaxID=1784712 RepID=A0A3A1P7G7_9SPHN|nr:2-amino-4-hydroxy-6-hydroxymethyldihydropteridine diphosphokinase [Aurantiacibacter xanthus]RIV89587.1 2-amino-4-hydroxy-6-hydroxymethyldihydropteridine diphosphokinase [Aurantiacibacter xanthus]